jgi:multisubunit Na+/H+ antiporter MnhG subunit
MGCQRPQLEWSYLNFSYEGLIGLTGATCMLAAFPVLLFGDYFDPTKRPTKFENAAAIVCVIGLCLAVVAFLLMIRKMI